MDTLLVQQLAPDTDAGLGGHITPTTPRVGDGDESLPEYPVLSPTGELLGFITIEEDGQLLVGHWLAHCTPETVIAGMRVALEILREHPCRAVLSDGSAVTGDWSELVSWMQYDLLPRVIDLGVRFIANVRSPDPAGRLAHQDYARHASQFLSIRLFDELAPAREWLRHVLATE